MVLLFTLQPVAANDLFLEKREAAALLARQDPRMGLAALQELLKDHPGDKQLLADTILAANWASQDRLALEIYQKNPVVEDNADAVEAAARSARNERDLALATTLFHQTIKLAPERWQPRLGLALTLAEDGNVVDSEVLLESLLLEQGQNTEAMAGSAYGFQILGKPIRSLAAYQLWMEQEPENEDALNGAALALSKVHGNYRANQLDASDTLTRIEIAAGLAGQRVRWGQSYAPSRIIQKEESTAALAHIDLAEDLAEKTRARLSAKDRKREHEISMQLAFDRIVTLRDLHQMQQVRESYENLTKNNPAPSYVREAAADAYLALHLPALSEALYLDLVLEKPELATPWIGLAYSMLELENPAGALATMAEAVHRSPIWLEAPGLRTPQSNPDHEMIETQAALMLSFAEELPNSQKQLEKLRNEAPANTSIREALARTYLARGWPIRGEEELLIAQTFEPGDAGITLAMAEVLESQGRRDESDQAVSALMSTGPDQERLIEFLKDRDVDRGWKVTLGTIQGIGNGNQVGTADHHVETRVESPLLDNRWGFFVTQLYDAADYAAGDADRIRVGGGVRYDYAGRKAWLALSRNDGSAAEPLIVEGGGSLVLGDHWLWEAEGSSDSLKVPLQAARSGVHGYGGETSLTWRQNEGRSITAASAFTRFDDGNDRGEVTTTWKERLFTSPKLKLNSKFLGYGSFNTAKNRPYFNPRHDLELGPWLELDWLTARHYDFEFHQYVAVYGGAYWQEDFGTGPAFSARYGQRWQLEYGTAITMGIIYGRRPYDGQQEDRIAFEFGFEWGGK